MIRSKGLRLVGAAVLAASMVALSAAQATAAPPRPTDPRAKVPAAVPGDNGDVKIHRLTTPAHDPRNEPKVCGFYLVGFNFDAGQKVRWVIVKSPPFKQNVVLSGTLTMNANGHGRTAGLALPDGHYKLIWTFVGENGRAKHKVFKVDCKPDRSPSPSTSHPGSPSPSASESASPSPSTSESTAPGASTTPSGDVAGDQPDDSLPITGTALTAVLGAGLALLLAGGAALFVARRRSASTEQPES